LADWDAYAARRAQSEAAGKLRGRSITYYVDNTGVFNERMELRFDPSGELTIVAGTLSHGQGHETSYAQMVADWLGVPEDKIHLAQADTDEVAIGRGTYASRSMMIGGSALRAAAAEVIERGKRFAAHFMEANAADIAFADGQFTISGTDRSMPIEQVAQMSFIPVGLPSELGVGLQGAGAYNPDQPTFPNGCHICEVEIDRETGEVALDRYTVVDDIGTVINPLLAKGQIQGGVAQGAGQALSEDVVYDEGSGQLLTGTLLDYAIPRADTLPRVTVDFSPVPSPTNPLGAKGVGEGGTVAATPSVMNAILDALSPLGVTDVPMPATPNASGAQSAMHGAKVAPAWQLSFIDHDIPQYHFRIGFEFRRRVEHFRYQQIFHWCTVNEGISCIIWIAFKIQLRHEPILSTCHLEMYVRGPDQVGPGGVSARFDCLEAIPAFRIASQDSATIKIRIERRRIGVAWVRVAAIAVRLPQFDFGINNGLSGKVQNPPHDVEHLPLRVTGMAGQSCQIGSFRQFL